MNCLLINGWWSALGSVSSLEPSETLEVTSAGGAFLAWAGVSDLTGAVGCRRGCRHWPTQKLKFRVGRARE